MWLLLLEKLFDLVSTFHAGLESGDHGQRRNQALKVLLRNKYFMSLTGVFSRGRDSPRHVQKCCSAFTVSISSEKKKAF